MSDKATQKADNEPTLFEHIIRFTVHAAPVMLALVTLPLASKAFGDKTSHLGLLVIEICFLAVSFSLALGYLRGRPQQLVGLIAFAIMAIILMANSAVGYFITEDGYLPKTAPAFALWWQKYLLALSPTIAAVTTIIFGMVDGNVLEKVSARAHRQALTNGERKIERAQGQAEMRGKLATAIAQTAAAKRLTARVRKLAKSTDFTPQAEYVLSGAVQSINDDMPLLEMGKQSAMKADAPTPTGITDPKAASRSGTA